MRIPEETAYENDDDKDDDEDSVCICSHKNAKVVMYKAVFPYLVYTLYSWLMRLCKNWRSCCSFSGSIDAIEPTEIEEEPDPLENLCIVTLILCILPVEPLPVLTLTVVVPVALTLFHGGNDCCWPYGWLEYEVDDG